VTRIRVEESYLAAVYQVAGDRLLADDLPTEGQKARLTELILNALSKPEDYTPEIIHDLYRMAKLP